MHAFIVFASTLAVASAGLVSVAPVTSNFHAQDELGQYSYGYSGGPSSKVETKTADGVVRGGYSYIDANGIVQSAQYVADPINGFRVAATNLPVGPAPAPAVLAAAPVARAVVAAPAFAAPIARAIAAPALYAAHAPAIYAAAPTYHAAAAPLNNGAVHIASLPVHPDFTPEVKAATIAHLAARG